MPCTWSISTGSVPETFQHTRIWLPPLLESSAPMKTLQVSWGMSCIQLGGGGAHCSRIIPEPMLSLLPLTGQSKNQMPPTDLALQPALAIAQQGHTDLWPWESGVVSPLLMSTSLPMRASGCTKYSSAQSGTTSDGNVFGTFLSFPFSSSFPCGISS